MLKASLLSSVLISSLSVVHAANLYVAKGGTGSDCSLSNPCGMIQKAVNVAMPGDQINVGSGKFTENVRILPGKSGLKIIGAGIRRTKVISAGGVDGVFAPPGVATDIIFDVLSPNVVISDMSLIHPNAVPTKRDIGVFVRPPAVNVSIENCSIKRKRTGNALEPTRPGSRGILVFRATGTNIKSNKLRGNYEDHIHLPTSGSMVMDNSVEDATRIGIVIIQESAVSFSVENVISDNEVEGSVSDGIQVQGDNNTVMGNEVEENGGVGINLCGPTAVPACVAPGQTTTASGNIVKNNEVEENGLGGIIDNGTNNIVMDNEEDDD